MSFSKDFWTAFSATLITLIYAIASFTAEDAEVFLFPRIVAALMSLFCVLLWLGVRKSMADESTGWMSDLVNLFPGVLIGTAYVLTLEWIGFYTASFLAFFLIAFVHDGQSNRDVRSVLKKLVVTTAFMVVLYLLFRQGLHVRTPTGLLI